MSPTATPCFKCGETDSKRINLLFGYTICDQCEKELALMTPATIQKHAESFQLAKDADPSLRNYEEEVEYRLLQMEKDYISKRIKLLHIGQQLKRLNP